MSAFDDTLKQYGASPDKLLRLDQNSAPLLQYASLVNARDAQDKLHALTAVYEWQESPLIYLADGNAINDDDHFSYIRRVLALRGDAPYLGVVTPGQLSIYRISLDKESKSQCGVDLQLVTPEEQVVTFPKLSNERPGATKARQLWVSGLVLSLLKEAIDDLIVHQHVNANDAISLAGRALFARFLADRGLLQDSLEPASCFDSADKIEKTSSWLDVTFNGDFLPISKNVIQSLSDESCKTLGNISRKAKGGQLYLGWENNWDYLDFSHIPIGVLSQSYEQYMRDHMVETQKNEGSFYTPHFIVDLMVKGAFHALRAEGIAHKARVLDPAAGAGVFLISVFQRLVQENWQQSGVRPNTKKLREILYNQIVGFDINEGALRFASLGLYLIAIELDPNPHPVKKLKFENDLRDKVLFRFVGEGGERNAGSLGEQVGIEHTNAYDLVIGNPPWTTNTRNPCWPEISRVVTQIAQERLGDSAPGSLLPRQCLDLPFVWRAMKWVRENGQIALALSARVLFQQGTTMPEARQALFSALDVSGVLNGADLRTTNVWPHVDSPFCLLFARNQLPQGHASSFRFISPRLEKSLNDSGVLRVDANNAENLNYLQLCEHPALFKTFFRGTSLDFEILDKLTRRGAAVPLSQYWKEIFGEAKGCLNNTGQGFGRLRKATITPKFSGNMKGMPELTKEKARSILIDTNDLPLFNLDSLHRSGKEEIYKAPILILHQVPSASSGRITSSMASDDLVYSESFYGYSASGFESSDVLIEYLTLLIGSKFALWYVLMVSGKFGYEREVVEKMLIQRIPLVPLDELSTNDRGQISTLFQRLAKENTEQNWLEVDRWVTKLFGLNASDLQVINDTLQYNLPFAENKKMAQAEPDKQQITDFCDELNAQLAPWAKRFKTKISVFPIDDVVAGAPWEILAIQAVDVNQDSFHWAEILKAASEIGTTEVFMSGDPGNGLWVARLKQGRYWSRSQARLLAQRIIWEHIEAILVQRNAA